MYCLDTDVCEALLNDEPDALRKLETIDRSRRYTSNVVVGELFASVYRGSDPEQGIERLNRMLLAIRVQKFDFDASAAQEYGRICAELTPEELAQLNIANLQIAAVVRSRFSGGSHVLLSRNRAYSLVAGIALESW
jgi:predicted nucleic acid-binding protein